MYPAACPSCGVVNNLTDTDLGCNLNCGSCGEPFRFGDDIVAERKRVSRERRALERETQILERENQAAAKRATATPSTSPAAPAAPASPVAVVDYAPAVAVVNPNLTTCPDCRREVSKNAVACPHCGRAGAVAVVKRARSSWYLVEVFGAFIFAFGIAGIYLGVQVTPGAQRSAIVLASIVAACVGGAMFLVGGIAGAMSRK